MIFAKIFLDGSISLIYDKNTSENGSMFQVVSKKHRTIRFGPRGGSSNEVGHPPLQVRQSRFESESPIKPEKAGPRCSSTSAPDLNPRIWPREHRPSRAYSTNGADFPESGSPPIPRPVDWPREDSFSQLTSRGAGDIILDIPKNHAMVDSIRS
jgi:hypothetical protein